MPTGGHYETLKDQLAADIREVWADTKEVYFGIPRIEIEETDLPVTIVLLDQLTNDPGGEATTAKQCHQAWEFAIVRVFKVPPIEENLQDAKVALADPLVARLESSTNYAGVGMFPTVTRIGYGERFENLPNGATTVEIDFGCVTRRYWGT